MNYFLLANNPNFCIDRLQSVLLNPDLDIFVLFNRMLPLQNMFIQNYSNKICILRKKPKHLRLVSELYPDTLEFYQSMSQAKIYENLFQKIYFLPCLEQIPGLQEQQDHIENINKFQFKSDKIDCIPYDVQQLNKVLNYTGTGYRSELSSGLIVYEYLKKKKLPEDKIILVSFSGWLTQKGYYPPMVIKYHDSDWEIAYFKKEIEDQKCYAIDSYGITNFT